MDIDALERARKRVTEGASDGVGAARLDAALERARREVMRLAQVAGALEESLPKQVAIAVRDGVAREVFPVSRSLAELRGSVNQALRRLERLEEELLADRNARVDDLGILIELIATGSSGTQARLARLEMPLAGQSKHLADLIPPQGCEMPQPTRSSVRECHSRLGDVRDLS